MTKEIERVKGNREPSTQKKAPRQKGRKTVPVSEAIEDAASPFIDILLPLADRHDSQGYPLWYRWALREAFVAGLKYATLYGRLRRGWTIEDALCAK